MKNVLEMNVNENALENKKWNILIICLTVISMVTIPISDLISESPGKSPVPIIVLGVSTLVISIIMASTMNKGIGKAISLAFTLIFLSAIVGIFISVWISEDPKAHNLLPIELLIYFVIFLGSSVLGASLGWVLKKMIKN